MIWSLDATVTCPLKSPKRTSGRAVPASSCPEYSMTTSPPGSAALGITFLIVIPDIIKTLPIRIETTSGRQERTIPRRHRPGSPRDLLDRKSTRLNSSHGYISYAVFCLKKKKKKHNNQPSHTS